MTDNEQMRAKQAAKPKHSPLPSPQPTEQARGAVEPVAWWNGIRKDDLRDESLGPSIRWAGENSAHDIPLYSAPNAESEIIKAAKLEVLERLSAQFSEYSDPAFAMVVREIKAVADEVRGAV